MKFPGLLCIVGLATVCVCAAASAERTREIADFDQGNPAFSLVADPFDFHSGLWVNLHHFLYKSALPLPPGYLPEPLPAMSQSEQKIWAGAVEFYRQHIVQLDPGDDRLQPVDSYLAKMESSIAIKGDVIGNDISEVLTSAAPIYRRFWWPQHDAANQFWIRTIQPLVAALGAKLRSQLTQAYETEWPGQLIRVDVSVYANWGGAYTNLEPGGLVHTVISSMDPGYQGFAAIEMLFHEASHSMVDGETGKLGEAIRTQAKAHGIPVPDQFWHALIFYTAGELARRDLNDVGIRNYEPYATKQGLWRRSSFRNYGDILSIFWKAHMDGKLSLNDAVSQMMNALAIIQSGSSP